MKLKECPLCHTMFMPNNNKQKYCNRPITRICSICGKEFQSTCNPKSPLVCSIKCVRGTSISQERTCAICGDKFIPNSARQRYCKHPKIKICPICNQEFTYPCGTSPNTCDNTKCKKQYLLNQQQNAYKSEVRKCKWCGIEFTPVNNTQIYCRGNHFRKCVVCGKEFAVDLTKQDIPKTCSKSCMHELQLSNGNPFDRPGAKEKQVKTLMTNYGVDHPMRSPILRARLFNNYKQRTGYDHPLHNPEVRSRMAKHAKQSKLEEKVKRLFDEYHIEYVHHYMISDSNHSHEFDFYLPKYKYLIDCDGIYYHSYLSDPDGKHVLDYYDEDRLLLVPKDYIFQVIVEGDEERCIKQIVDNLKQIDNHLFDYEGDLFNWCRSISFPYPNYTKDRILKDYAKLCTYSTDKYNPAARLGISAINQFHKSIYDAHVGDYPSPKEAWEDDKLLKKVIANRLIYKNDVDPYKIMKGFNISKLCPRVSLFNPVLARYLILKYLNVYSTIFDPFSGYSGRLLGAASTNKQYIGHDINTVAIQEANDLIKFLNLQNVSVSYRDVLSASGNYECLLTCPPYNKKEIYSTETDFKSCDDWITFILTNYHCSKYVFVVDTTNQYRANIVEEIKSTSHFNKTMEYVVVI